MKIYTKYYLIEMRCYCFFYKKKNIALLNIYNNNYVLKNKVILCKKHCFLHQIVFFENNVLQKTKFFVLNNIFATNKQCFL